VDAQIIQDAARFKMDLAGGLERTLQGKVKPSMLNLSCNPAALDDLDQCWTPVHETTRNIATLNFQQLQLDQHTLAQVDVATDSHWHLAILIKSFA
jgi:hypothetical protein